MKVLMLIPPQPRSQPGRWFLREERHAAKDNTPVGPYMAPSILGLMRQKCPAVELRVLDWMTLDWSMERMKKEVADIAPDLIIAVLCANHLGDMEERFCAELPYPTIGVVTPVGASISDAVKLYGIKCRWFVSNDEVEAVLAEAVSEFSASGTIEKTKGVVIQRDGQLIDTGIAPYSDMASYPLPAFDLFPWEDYRRLQAEVTLRRPEYADTAILNGMKGCPFHCNFCIVGGEAAKARTKTGLQIFQEVDHLYRHHGMRRFNFMDSEFGANKKSAVDFCNLVIQGGLSIRFDIKNRIEFQNEDLLALMKKAGCERVFYGIETADPRLQKVINKNLDLEKARKAIEVTKRHGMKVLLYIMVGIPGETDESLRLSAKFVAETKPDGISWGLLFPEVGSPWYDELKRTGKLLEPDWKTYRQHDRLTFEHDVYRSGSDMKRAQLRMRNEYRWLLARDSTLKLSARVAYLARFGIGKLKHAAWGAIENSSGMSRLYTRLGTKFGAGLDKLCGESIL